MALFRLVLSEKKIALNLPEAVRLTKSTIRRVYSLPHQIVRMPISNSVLGLIIGFSVILIALIYSLLTYQIYFFSRTHLGVYVDGIAVSHLTHRELKQHISRQAQHILQRPITLEARDAAWTLTAAELGARVDVDKTVAKAYAVGRGHGFLADLREQLSFYQTPLHIHPTIIFDSGPTNTKLNQIAQELYQPPRNARITIDDHLNVIMTPAQIGQMLDVKVTREAIRQSIISRGRATIPLQINLQNPKISDVADTHARLKKILSEPLIFSFKEQRWIIEPETLVTLISIEESGETNGPRTLEVQLDPDPLYLYFRNLAKEIYQEPVNAWFDLDEETWTLRPIIESQDKHTLYVEEAVSRMISQLENPTSNRIALPVIIERPPVPMENPEQFGFRELLSTSTTYFRGSTVERMQNIAVSASKFNGLVIPPDALFSFNEHLGDVTASNGFVESLIIQGDRTAVGIGGGVCQVSTTVFRAAFYGGFEIVERWAHGYRVSWYETGSAPGLDATIYSPTVDLKFRNDTASFILIQTNTDLNAGTVTFNFYGTSQGRTVTVTNPKMTNQVKHGPPIYEQDPTLKPGEAKQIDWAKDGVDVTVKRTVHEDDILLHQDTIFSRYLPWQAVYKVGPEIKPEKTLAKNNDSQE